VTSKRENAQFVGTMKIESYFTYGLRKYEIKAGHNPMPLNIMHRCNSKLKGMNCSSKMAVTSAQ